MRSNKVTSLVNIIKKPVHYTEQYIIDPPHPVTINVIGCGGTGSQVINSLARMHSALKALNHPGLFIKAVDPDRVTKANMGRQLFSSADIGIPKCDVLVSRVNRFFGTDWEGVPILYDEHAKIASANITISCVDTGAARSGIKKALFKPHHLSQRIGGGWGQRDATNFVNPYEYPYYWMDFGNMMDRGQVVIGTVRAIKQPDKSDFNCVEQLPTIDKYHPDILRDRKGEDQGPSCSLAEALSKQDLFINTNLANMGLGILWKMFRELRIEHHGCYVNLASLNVNPIKISA